MIIWLAALPVQSAPLRISILQVEASPMQQELSLSLMKVFSQANHSVQLIHEMNDTIPAADMIVAIGVKSSRMAASSKSPVLGVLLPKANYEALLHETSSRPEKFTAIYFEQPGQRQIDLISAALPNVRAIGVLYASHAAEISDLRKSATERQFVFREQRLHSSEDLHRDLQSILLKSDVLLAVPDPLIYNPSTLRNILLTTYRNQIPVIGFSEGYVRAGALCAIFSSTDQLARQAAAMIDQFAANNRLPAAQYPKEFEIAINRQVARSLDIPLPDLEKLRERIRSNHEKIRD